jgi:hypothetical protein
VLCPLPAVPMSERPALREHLVATVNGSTAGGHRRTAEGFVFVRPPQVRMLTVTAGVRVGTGLLGTAQKAGSVRAR